MEMIFWFGGILGVLLFVVGLFMLLQGRRAWVLTLVGLVLSSLLIPALGLFKDTQAYLITGAAGAVLLLVGLLLKGRWRGALAGIGAVAGMFLLPAFNLTAPWQTNPIEIVNGLQSASTPAPTPTTASDPAAPTVPVTPDPNASLPSTTDPSAVQGDPNASSGMPSADPNAPLASDPNLSAPSLTDPNAGVSSDPNASSGTQTPVDPSTQPLPEPTPTQPSLPSEPQATPPVSGAVGAVVSEELCPCLLRVSSGLSNATVQLSRQGGATFQQSGAVVDFSNLELGDYIVTVQAPGYTSYSSPLRITNNRSLTVNLLRQ